MIKAVITDFDGVIRHWNGDGIAQVEHECKLPEGTLSAYRFTPDILQPAITGKIPFEGWAKLVYQRIEKRYGLGIAERFSDAWLACSYKIDHDLIAQYRSLFPEARIALATNATSRLPSEMANANLDGLFDCVYNSSAMGVAKPSLQYFQAVLMSMGLSAKDVIFIDDSLDNVMAARKIGIESFHFESRSQIKESLMLYSLHESALSCF